MDRPDPDELRRRRDSLIAQIERDFEGVSRRGGVSISEAHAIDDWESDASCAAARKGDKDSQWTELDIEHQDPGGSALSFMDPIGFRYHLPAYLCYTLRCGYREITDHHTDHFTHESIIYKLGGADGCYNADRWELLSDSQRACVARFLAFDAEFSDEMFLDLPLGALKRYWLRYLPEVEQTALRERWPQLHE